MKNINCEVCGNPTYKKCPECGWVRPNDSEMHCDHEFKEVIDEVQKQKLELMQEYEDKVRELEERLQEELIVYVFDEKENDYKKVFGQKAKDLRISQSQRLWSGKTTTIFLG